MTSDVVALGEMLIDFAFCGADAAGYPTMAANPGGAPCNFLAALAQYGVKTAFLGKVGDDAFGHLLVKTAKDLGIATEGIVMDPDVFTTLAFVTLDAGGERSFSFARKPGADTCLRFEELALDLIDNCRAFHFGTLSLTHEPARTTTQRAVAYAGARGKLITFDPNLRLPLWRSEREAKEQMLWGLSRADVVKTSGEEVNFLWGCTPEEGAERLLRDCGISLAMVTLGAEGCHLRSEGVTYTAPSPKAAVVDTTGAGDVFGGSAVARLLELGKEPADLTARDLAYIADYALAAASLSTEKRGGLPSVPTRSAVLAQM